MSVTVRKLERMLPVVGPPPPETWGGQQEVAMKQAIHALVLAFGATVAMIPPAALAGPADDVQAAMQLLEAKSGKLGTPVLKGDEAVAGKMVPALYLGDAKMNNSFTLVDEVQAEKGGTATIFVKSGDEFVRVATNVKKDDGSRATGTIL